MTGVPAPPRRHDEVSDETSRWFVRLRARPEARLRLVCFHSAGAGASAFGRWPDDLPADVEPWAVQLPGRETRRSEPPLTDIVAMAGEVAARITPLLDRPFAIFGHSMGALAAFETVRRLQENGKEATMLFVSGRVPPHIRHDPEQFETLSDDDFLTVMDERYGGIPSLLREDAEFRELYLPPLRADATAVSRYDYVEGGPLTCPIRALGGLNDKSVSRDALEAWERHTAGGFGARVFPGDHFYIQTARAALLGHLSAELAKASEDAAGRSRA